MPKQTVEQRLQGEIDKVDAKIHSLEQQKHQLERERGRLVKALVSLKGEQE